jgi:hypothetical protein
MLLRFAAPGAGSWLAAAERQERPVISLAAAPGAIPGPASAHLALNHTAGRGGARGVGHRDGSR